MPLQFATSKHVWSKLTIPIYFVVLVLNQLNKVHCSSALANSIISFAMQLYAAMQNNSGAVSLLLARIQMKIFARIETQLQLKAFT